MANALYNKARESFLGQNPALDYDTDTIKVALVSSGYVFSQTHQFVSSLGANIIARSSALSGKTVTSGIADAADITLSAVPGPTPGTALVLYKDSGTGDATSPLIAYIDTATGLPVTPNGGDITIVWDNATNKIFKL